MILGAKIFVNIISKGVFVGYPHNDLPQQKQLSKNIKLAGFRSVCIPQSAAARIMISSSPFK
jgi:hypothetical protein